MDKSPILEEDYPTHRLTVALCNQKGLHARASGEFVKVAQQFDAEVSVCSKGRTVSGDSIMGLIMLSARNGSVLEIEASGKQAHLALQALEDLVKNKFNEEK